MITYSSGTTILQRLAQDTSTDGLSFLWMMANIGYKEVLADLGRQATELEATANLEASQRGYQMPPDCVWPKTIILVDGTTTYPIIEEPSDKYWTLLTQNNSSGRPTRFHFKPRFGVGGGVMELDPIPSSSDYDLKMIYEAGDKDLSKASYTTGTVSVTNGDATVTGSGTTFTSDMVGRYFKVTSDGHDRLWYKIASLTSTTEIELENVYEGSTGTTLNYTIDEAFNLPEEMHMLPIYYALWHHWSSKKDTQRANDFKGKYDVGMALAKKRHSVVTRDNIINYDTPAYPFTDSYPQNFPTSLGS